MNKRKLYESIMRNVAKEVKKALNESNEVEHVGELTNIDPKVEELAEIVNNSENWDPEDINNKLFDILVSMSGKATTLGGEILRAVNRIVYRNWNDGDVAGKDYGRETVNPAVRFLYAKVFKPDQFKVLVEKLYDMVTGLCLSDEEYGKLLNDLVKECVLHIVNNKLYTVPNDEDMWDYKDEDEDVDRYEEEEEYWEDDWENA